MRCYKLTHDQSGLTILELMIVVAIVGILAAIAIPSYQTYTLRAKFTEVIEATAPVKTAIEVCYQDTGALNQCGTFGVAGLPAAPTATNYLSAITLSSTASSVTIIATGSPAVNNLTYKLNGTLSGSQLIWSVDSTSTCVAAGVCRR